MTDTSPTPSPQKPSASRRRPHRAGGRPDAAAAAPRHPLLSWLAERYPGLFGAQPLPLKRGIFQDLLTTHPEELPAEGLKAALALHTRATPYLNAVAAGQARHDLSLQPVEAMAPEHVYHALLEVFRRRHRRSGEDVRDKLRQRMVQAFEASGLRREDYAARMQGRDAEANALLEEALAEASVRAARDEALLRAFEASAQSLEAFADMYGLPAAQARQTLDRARQRRQVDLPR